MKEDSLLSRIFTSGFFAVIFGGFALMIGFIIYRAVTRPDEGFAILLMIVAMVVAGLILVLAWGGLIWLMRSQIKLVKKTVDTIIGACVFMLVIATGYFLLSGIFNLYGSNSPQLAASVY